MRPLVLAVSGLVCLTTALTGSLPARSTDAVRVDTARTAVDSAARTSANTVPALRVTRMVSGLSLPWDVKYASNGRLLITERSTKRLLTWRLGKLRPVSFPASTVWANGETGLMSLAIDPGYESNRRFYTCQGSPTAGGGHDVRVLAWRLNTAATAATLTQTLLTGLPSHASGRHGGCRLLITSKGSLLVGTGDASTSTNPQDRTSLGGKTLHLNRMTGQPWPTNPFISSGNANERYVLTYGHRNVQGLAQRPGGTLWSVEHGSDRDDEVNQLGGGHNYGWDPGPGYNETNTPMTDHDLPGTQTNAKWRSGYPTVATSGAAWVRGDKWGIYENMLAVATLKGERVMFMRFDKRGSYVGMRVPNVLRKYGRLRSISRLPDGSLMVTTSNGNGNDSVLKVKPVG
jgi:glucose/arabinose dehydrogenase